MASSGLFESYTRGGHLNHEVNGLNAHLSYTVLVGTITYHGHSVHKGQIVVSTSRVYDSIHSMVR